MPCARTWTPTRPPCAPGWRPSATNTTPCKISSKPAERLFRAQSLILLCEGGNCIMMEGTYYKEWSTALGRDMEFKVYGTGGVPVLAFPCQGGRFYDWENNGMPDAAAWLIQNGRIQLFCADSIDQDSFLAEGLSPRRRAEMQEKYFCYITGELAPRILALNAAAAPQAADKPARAAKPGPVLWAVGADLGAYQAVNCRLRRPELFCGAIGLSGRYDVSGWLGGPED